MAMKAGDLRIRIGLLRPTDTRDGTLRRGVTFEEIRTVPAAVADVSGKEFYQAHAVHAEDIVTYTIRNRSDVTTAWRVRRGTVEYDILEVNHLGYMGDYMRLKCRAVGPGGR